jgi:hypothetical protein
MTDEEITHVRHLLDETKKRHHVLEIQAARYGPSRVPAEIAIELRETEESMERLNAKLRIVTVPTIIQEATGPESSIDVLRMNVKQMGEQMGTMWRYLEHMILEDRAVTEDWRIKQTAERRIGVRERRIIELVLAIGVGVAIYLAVR